ncbi:MAG: hypothetical protein PWQ45_940 [Thermosipho sp. (in: thermotogales)]|nr:hypothetical protein [Thermosipho sp. (in: thermotogales)]
MSLENLNLYKDKEKRISLKRFLIYLIISFLPFFSLYYFSQFFLFTNIANIIRNHPLVFNEISFNELTEIPDIVDLKISEYDSKINSLINKIRFLKTSLNKSFFSKYFLQVLVDELSNINKYFFIKNIEFDGKSFLITFYEYSENPIVPETIKEKLSKYYKNVELKVTDIKNVYENFKMYELQLGGEL